MSDKERFLKELSEMTPPPSDNTDDNILWEEVMDAVRRLKRNKSPGNGGITAEMIKAGGEKLLGKIHSLCNQAWVECHVPEEWLKSVLVPIPKKGGELKCKSYRIISLISHIGKIFMMILQKRLHVDAQLEAHMADEQVGFRKDRSTIQQILMLRLLAEKAKRKGMKICNCFADFQKVFDSLDQQSTWAVMKSYGIEEKLVKILQLINTNAKAAVRIRGELGEWFNTTRGTRQGDNVSPKTFIEHLERVMDKNKERGKGISINGVKIDNLHFADEIDLLEE